MKKRLLFGGKKVLLIAPGPNCKVLEVDFRDFDFVCLVGDFWKIKKILVPKTIDRVDVAYCNPSFICQVLYYRLQLPDSTLFKTSSDHRYFEDFDFPDSIVDYNFSFNKKCEEIGCNLTTGMAAILDILEDKPELLYLHGFTFYKSEIPYSSGYTSKFDSRIITATKGNISGHNQDILFNHFKSLLSTNHILFDSGLAEILNNGKK